MTALKFRYRFIYGWFQLIDKLIGRKNGRKITWNSRKRFYDNVFESLKKQGEHKLIEVERVSEISQKDFREKYVLKGRPVVIEGGAKEWGCVKDWSLDYFNNLHGDDEVTIVANDANEIPFEILKFSDVLDNIKRGGKKYFRFYPLLSKHPEHIKDFDYNWLRNSRNSFSFWEQFQVFIGGKGTSTPIHNASASNIFVQAYGEKEWILYPPDLTTIIDPEPGHNFHRGAPFKTSDGPFNPFNPNYDAAYSVSKYTVAIKVHLKAGDIFFNPPHYWHAVTNPTDSIGIGYRWISPWASFKAAPWYTILDALDVPFNKTVYLHMKKDYNLIHLMELGEYDEFLKQKNSKKDE